MFCYQSVPGGVHGMRSCGHERVAFWEESWHEIYVGKHTQKQTSMTKRGDDTPAH